MSDSGPILHLYTLHFPQGSHEAFIEPELPYLCEAFSKVKIFPQMRSDEPMRTLPENVEVVFLKGEKPVKLMKRLGFTMDNLFKRPYLFSIRYQLGKVAQLIQRSELLSAYINDHEEAIHYSYWFDEWATVLGSLSKVTDFKEYTARAHGFDLYDERQSLGYHPFRKMQLNGLKKLFPVSDLGSSYLAKRLPEANIETAYLGTEDQGQGPLPEIGPIRIISVARVVPLKRLDRIVNVLSLCTSPVHWTHIGGGAGLDELQEKVTGLPAHIQVDLIGDRSHDEVMRIYQEQPFHLLISLSESEGIPVSMMEAMSFGVPVLSTDVGAVHELVNDMSGVLVPSDIEDREIASHIDQWVSAGRASSKFREGVQKCWEAGFSAKKNYPLFIEELKSLQAS